MQFPLYFYLPTISFPTPKDIRESVKNTLLGGVYKANQLCNRTTSHIVPVAAIVTSLYAWYKLAPDSESEVTRTLTSLVAGGYVLKNLPSSLYSLKDIVAMIARKVTNAVITSQVKSALENSEASGPLQWTIKKYEKFFPELRQKLLRDLEEPSSSELYRFAYAPQVLVPFSESCTLKLYEIALICFPSIIEMLIDKLQSDLNSKTEQPCNLADLKQEGNIKLLQTLLPPFLVKLKSKGLSAVLTQESLEGLFKEFPLLTDVVIHVLTASLNEEQKRCLLPLLKTKETFSEIQKAAPQLFAGILHQLHKSSGNETLYALIVKILDQHPTSFTNPLWKAARGFFADTESRNELNAVSPNELWKIYTQFSSEISHLWDLIHTAQRDTLNAQEFNIEDLQNSYFVFSNYLAHLARQNASYSELAKAVGKQEPPLAFLRAFISPKRSFVELKQTEACLTMLFDFVMRLVDQCPETFSNQEKINEMANGLVELPNTLTNFWPSVKWQNSSLIQFFRGLTPDQKGEIRNGVQVILNLLPQISSFWINDKQFEVSEEDLETLKKGVRVYHNYLVKKDSGKWHPGAAFLIEDKAIIEAGVNYLRSYARYCQSHPQVNANVLADKLSQETSDYVTAFKKKEGAFENKWKAIRFVKFLKVFLLAITREDNAKVWNWLCTELESVNATKARVFKKWIADIKVKNSLVQICEVFKEKLLPKIEQLVLSEKKVNFEEEAIKKVAKFFMQLRKHALLPAYEGQKIATETQFKQDFEHLNSWLLAFLSNKKTNQKDVVEALSHLLREIYEIVFVIKNDVTGFHLLQMAKGSIFASSTKVDCTLVNALSYDQIIKERLGPYLQDLNTQQKKWRDAIVRSIVRSIKKPPNSLQNAVNPRINPEIVAKKILRSHDLDVFDKATLLGHVGPHLEMSPELISKAFVETKKIGIR